MGLFSRSRKTADTAAAGSPTAASTAVANRSALSDLSHLSGEYVIDTVHSEIGFSVRHAMVTNVRGAFTEYEGVLKLDGADPANSSANLAIKVASIDTNQAQRDEHLRTGDFFDAQAFPRISFRSTGAEQLDAETFRLTGDLTIKGTTKPVSIDFALGGAATDLYGNDRVGFEGSTTIDRTDFGLTYNAALETGGVLIGEKVKLSFDISAIKAA
jgi:polyisoprenoid-binding protein YceI